MNVAACIKLDTKSGPAGSSVKVTGTGLQAGEIVDIFFDQKMVDTVNADCEGQGQRHHQGAQAARRKGKHTCHGVGPDQRAGRHGQFKVT